MPVKNNVSEIPQETSWIDSLKQNLDFNTCIKNLNLTSCKIIEIVTYFGIGFFIGFILKRFSKLLVPCLILLFITLLLLDHLNLATVNWLKLREIIGINPAETIGGLTQAYVTWIRINILKVIGGLLGFLIGYKIG